MAILNVNGQLFNYPDPGREPGWGEDATAWAEAVSNVISGAIAPGDIRGSVDLSPTVTATNITGMLVNSLETVSAEVLYYVSRTSQYQSGKLTLTRIDSDWSLSNEYVGDPIGLVFTVLATGQIQYTLTGGAVSIKFRFITVEV